MTFLHPILLATLPLVALPVIIHLINQRRYQSVRWAAMIFLLAANRMSRGYARLRQMLILLVRMLALAGLIFALSRPLAGGWLGRAASGRPDTTMILLDRSPSMKQHGSGTVVSKLESGRHQLAETLQVRGSNRWVLIESTTNTAREIESPAALLRLPATEPASTSADLPALLEAARDYIRANRPGRTEIWICSDLRRNDWSEDSARWQALRDSFLEFPQSIRLHLLAYPDVAPSNVAIEITNVRRRQTADSAEVLVSLKLLRATPTEAAINLPVQFEIEGARSEVNVELTGSVTELKDYRIPIERTHERGWGKVSIPADANPADNEFYFVFDRPQLRKTVIVSGDGRAMAALHLAAAISSDPAFPCSAEIVTREQVAAIDWDSVALLAWHAPLPEGEIAQTVQAFVRRGGQVLFLPPRSPGESEFLGARWQNWIEEPADIPMETWRGDQDLLANTQSGAALPLDRLRIRRTCGLSGELTPLASAKGPRLLFARLPTNRGGVYFCATTPDAGDSSLAANGVVLYALVQRAVAAGAAVLGQTRQLVAGESVGQASRLSERRTGETPVPPEAAVEQSANWRQVAGNPDTISIEYPHHAGIYAFGDKLLAVNRAAAEDHAAVLADDRVAELFQGLNFSRVDDRAGSFASLIQEIWRPFLMIMLVSLLVEAALCLPRVRAPELRALTVPVEAPRAVEQRAPQESSPT